ncbi:unnamed protein product [Calypogeia fissa]
MSNGQPEHQVQAGTEHDTSIRVDPHWTVWDGPVCMPAAGHRWAINRVTSGSTLGRGRPTNVQGRSQFLCGPHVDDIQVVGGGGKELKSGKCNEKPTRNALQVAEHRRTGWKLAGGAKIVVRAYWEELKGSAKVWQGTMGG